jgi:hypothetical protein
MSLFSASVLLPVKPLAIGGNQKVEFFLWKDNATKGLPRPSGPQ